MRDDTAASPVRKQNDRGMVLEYDIPDERIYLADASQDEPDGEFCDGVGAVDWDAAHGDAKLRSPQVRQAR